VHAQQDDVRTALQLVSVSHRDTKQAARKPLSAAPVDGSMHIPAPGLALGVARGSLRNPQATSTFHTPRNADLQASVSRNVASTALLAARVAAAAVSASGGSSRPHGAQTQMRNNSYAEDLLRGLPSQQRDIKLGPLSHASSLAMDPPRSNYNAFDRPTMSLGPDDSRQSDQLKEDMHDLDEEMQQLEAMLQRASRQLG